MSQSSDAQPASDRHAEVNSRQNLFFFGPLDLSAERLDTNLRRRVRPECAEDFGLRPPGDVTSAASASTRTYAGVSDRCWLACALRAMLPATTVMVGLLRVAHIIDIRAA